MRILIAALYLLVFTNTWAAIGTVVDHKGTVCEIQRNKAKLSGIKGAEIESMDTYITGACVANIVFKDDTKVRVTENSRLLIDDFVFDPKQSDAERQFAAGGLQDVIEVDEHALRRFGPEVNRIRTVFHGPDEGFEHQVELALGGQFPAAGRAFILGQMVGAEPLVAAFAFHQGVSEAF